MYIKFQVLRPLIDKSCPKQTILLYLKVTI